ARGTSLSLESRLTVTLPRPHSFTYVLPAAAATLFPYTTLFRSPEPAPAPTPEVVSPAQLEQTGDATKPLDLTKPAIAETATTVRSEEHTSELQSRGHLVCRLLLEKKKYCRFS